MRYSALSDLFNPLTLNAAVQEVENMQVGGENNADVLYFPDYLQRIDLMDTDQVAMYIEDQNYRPIATRELRDAFGTQISVQEGKLSTMEFLPIRMFVKKNETECRKIALEMQLQGTCYTPHSFIRTTNMEIINTAKAMLRRVEYDFWRMWLKGEFIRHDAENFQPIVTTLNHDPLRHVNAAGTWAGNAFNAFIQELRNASMMLTSVAKVIMTASKWNAIKASAPVPVGVYPTDAFVLGIINDAVSAELGGRMIEIDTRTPTKTFSNSFNNDAVETYYDQDYITFVPEGKIGFDFRARNIVPQYDFNISGDLSPSELEANRGIGVNTSVSQHQIRVYVKPISNEFNFDIGLNLEQMPYVSERNIYTVNNTGI